MAGAAPGLSWHVLLPHPRARETWPASVGQGLDVQVFGVGGVAREPAVTWSRTLERSLCYSYGCWEVLEQETAPADRPGRRPLGGAGLEPLCAGVLRPARRWSSSSSITYYHAHQHDLAGEAGPETAPAYFHWRRSMAAIDLLDLEQAALGWTPTSWQRGLFPPNTAMRSSSCTTASTPAGSIARPGTPGGRRPRSIAGRAIPDATRVVSFVARSLDRLRGFDRFLKLADVLLRASTRRHLRGRGRPIVRRGLDVAFHNRDYAAHLLEQDPPFDPERLWFLGNLSPPSSSPRSWPPATCTSPRAGRIRWLARC